MTARREAVGATGRSPASTLPSGRDTRGLLQKRPSFDAGDEWLPTNT